MSKFMLKKEEELCTQFFAHILESSYRQTQAKALSGWRSGKIIKENHPMK